MPEPELIEYVLTPDELAMIDNCNAIAAAAQAEAQAILRTISRIRGLEGSWHYDNGKMTKKG